MLCKVAQIVTNTPFRNSRIFHNKYTYESKQRTNNKARGFLIQNTGKFESEVLYGTRKIIYNTFSHSP